MLSSLAMRHIRWSAAESSAGSFVGMTEVLEPDYWISKQSCFRRAFSCLPDPNRTGINAPTLLTAVLPGLTVRLQEGRLTPARWLMLCRVATQQGPGVCPSKVFGWHPAHGGWLCTSCQCQGSCQSSCCCCYRSICLCWNHGRLDHQT